MGVRRAQGELEDFDAIKVWQFSVQDSAQPVRLGLRKGGHDVLHFSLGFWSNEDRLN